MATLNYQTDRRWTCPSCPFSTNDPMAKYGHERSASEPDGWTGWFGDSRTHFMTEHTYVIRTERRSDSDRYPYVIRQTADGMFVSRHSTYNLAERMLVVLNRIAPAGGTPVLYDPAPDYVQSRDCACCGMSDYRTADGGCTFCAGSTQVCCRN